MTTILEVKGLTKTFGNHTALNNVSLILESGRVAGLMGPNGAGKTTLMKTVMKITKPNSGTICVCGSNTVEAIHRNTAFMPDRNQLFDWMRIRDAIHFYEDMFGDFDAKRAVDLCQILGLNPVDPIRSLSKGTVIRVLVMLTFSRNARLYLLDEPIGWFDPLAKQNILKTILAGINEESAVLISTHQVKDVETILDDVLFLNNGSLVLADTAENIREKHGQSIEDRYIEVFQNA
jgi:ABC-2 type transport system ATP-binding protein